MRSKSIAVLAGISVLCAGHAAFADTPIERVRACMREVNDAARLACYDVELGRSAAGQNADIGITGALLREQERQQGIAENSPPTYSAKVAAIVVRQPGKFVVSLDDGQVWAQTEMVDFPLKIGDMITIRRGLLGSLRLSVADRRAETLVRRIK